MPRVPPILDPLRRVNREAYERPSWWGFFLIAFFVPSTLAYLTWAFFKETLDPPYTVSFGEELAVGTQSYMVDVTCRSPAGCLWHLNFLDVGLSRECKIRVQEYYSGKPGAALLDGFVFVAEGEKRSVPLCYGSSQIEGLIVAWPRYPLLSSYDDDALWEGYYRKEGEALTVACRPELSAKEIAAFKEKHKPHNGFKDSDRAGLAWYPYGVSLRYKALREQLPEEAKCLYEASPDTSDCHEVYAVDVPVPFGASRVSVQKTVVQSSWSRSASGCYKSNDVFADPDPTKSGMVNYFLSAAPTQMEISRGRASDATVPGLEAAAETLGASDLLLGRLTSDAEDRWFEVSPNKDNLRAAIRSAWFRVTAGETPYVDIAGREGGVPKPLSDIAEGSRAEAQWILQNMMISRISMAPVAGVATYTGKDAFTLVLAALGGYLSVVMILARVLRVMLTAITRRVNGSNRGSESHYAGDDGGGDVEMKDVNVTVA